MKYVTSEGHDPEYNLSFEEYIFKNLPMDDEDEYIYLWINDKAVIVGRNQNTLREINLNYIEENDVKVVRRITGGGAVYHDMGNLNFSFVTKSDGPHVIDFKTYYTAIVDAMKSLGVPAELSGRNDITIEGMKCVGASQSFYKNRVLSNGCLLFDVDLSALSKALNPDPEKLKAKGVDSVRKRVTNVKPFLPDDVDIYAFSDRLLDKIFELKNLPKQEYKLSKEELDGVMEVYKNRFSRREWNYGRDPKTQLYKKKRLASGNVELSFDVDQNKVENLKIFGDFFGTKEVSELADKIKGTQYSKAPLLEALEGIDLVPYLGNVEKEELVDLFLQ